ncbi:hypothetical protein [Marinobacter sp.]|uniref:hypothetical protein n=1 Tax=Marinobacter sp. TaxID=50741 RepID=UPI003F9C1354
MNYSETQEVLTDKADKRGSVSVVSTLPPRIQKTQVLDQVTRQLNADRHMVMALLSDDDLEQIEAGLITGGQLADYLNIMAKDGKPLTDPQWHLDRLLKSAETKRRQNAQTCRKQGKAWKPAHESFINHVMACTACRAPQGRYCIEGQQRRQAYTNAYQDNTGEPSLCPAK